MNEEAAKLELQVDATSIDKATVSLASLMAAGEAAEAATDKTNVSLATLKARGEASATSNEKLAASARALGGEYAAAESAIAKMAGAVLAQDAALRAQVATAMGTTKALVDVAAAADAATAATKNFDSAGRVTTAGLDAYQAKMIAAAMAQTGMTEAAARAALGIKAASEASVAGGVAVAALGGAHGAAAGQVNISSTALREFFVIIREFAAGRWNRIPGSLSILASQFGLMTVSALGTAAAVLLLAAPFITFAAALALGSSEAAKLKNALTVTNGAVGESASQITASAEDIAKAMDYSQGKAIALYTHLVSTGKVTSDNIDLVAVASIRLSQLTGETATKISDELMKSFNDASKGAADLNEKYHFLTLAQYDQIEALQKAGDKQGAFTLLMQDLDAGLAKSTANMGFFEASIHSVATAFGNAFQAMKDFGKQAPIEQSVFTEMTKLNSMDTPYNQQQPGFADAYAAQQAKVTALQNQARDQMAAVDKKAADDQIQQAGIDAKRYLDQVDSVLGGSKQRMLQEIADYKAKVAAALKADPADAEALADQENMAARVAALAKKYDKTDYGKKPKAQKDPYQAEVDKLTTDITANRDLAAAYDLSTAAGFAATAQKAAAVEITRLHATGLDAEKIETLELDDAVTKALDAGAKWIDQAKQKNDISQQVLDIMSQTGESEAVAQKQVADGLELKKAEAVLANASAIDRPRALAQIQEITAAQADSNRIALERQALLDHEAASNQLQTLETELSLLGATNRERTVQLALLKEAQSLRTQGIPLSSAQGVSAVFDTVNTANAQQTLADGFSDPIKQQQYYISLLSEMQTRTSTATADMAASFGTLGKAVGDLTNAYTTYGKTTADIELKRSNDLKAADGDAVKSAIANNQALDSQRLAEAKYYGDALSAASEFFGQKTALFQLAQAAEKAWRLVEFALSVQSMIQRTAEVGVVTATEGAKTAVEVPASLARAAAKGAEGVAGIFAALGPFAFPVAAAAIAMMVAAGVSALGGSGSTVTLPGSTDAATRQAAQGAGTVLGDPAAQSKSIADALTLATANQNTDLQYSSQMVTSLRSIDDNISNFTAAIAKDLGVGGALSTASLNLGTTSSSSLFGLAGSTTTSTLQDQGLQFTPQTIAQIIAQGISGSSYNEVATDKKSSFLGIPTGNKTSLSTTNTALDASLSGDLTRVVASLENGVLSAASTLGITGAKATLDSLVLNLGTVSLKGLTGTALTDAINAVFSKAGDDMAAALLPAISTFQKAGEGAFETLTRLATDYQTVDTTLQSIGKTFTTVGVDSIAARENLVSLVGGVANLVSQTAAFSTAFLTPAQQLAPIQAAVTAEMNRLGLAGITTKDAFAQLVQGIDVSTSAGATLYAALMNVAPAFAKVADAATQAATDATTAANTAAATAVTNAQTDVTNATSALTSAYNTQASAIQSTITTFQGFADSLAAFNNSLSTGPLSGLNAQQQYSATQAAFQKTIATGDYGNVQTTGQAFLAAAQAIAPDAVAYAKDLAAVRIGVQAAQKAATAQVQFAEEQLAELQTQVGSLIDVNNSVLSVADAVRNLQAALGEQTSALVNQAILGSQQRIADNTAAVAANAATAAALAAAASTAPPAPVAPTDPAANDNTTPAAIAATVQAQISAALGGAGGLSGFGSNVQAFATGGSFTVGGSGAQDSKQFSMALSPGEAVNVSRPGEQAALVKELQALRAEVAGMRQEQQAGQIAIATNTGKMAKILQRVTPDGNSLSTAAA